MYFCQCYFYFDALLTDKTASIKNPSMKITFSTLVTLKCLSDAISATPSLSDQYCPYSFCFLNDFGTQIFHSLSKASQSSSADR